jgi:hypothetical protein
MRIIKRGEERRIGHKKEMHLRAKISNRMTVR